MVQQKTEGRQASRMWGTSRENSLGSYFAHRSTSSLDLLLGCDNIPQLSVFSSKRFQSRDSVLCRYRVVRSLLVKADTLQDVEQLNRSQEAERPLYIVWRLLFLWVGLPPLSFLFISSSPAEMLSPPFWFSRQFLSIFFFRICLRSSLKWSW